MSALLENARLVNVLTQRIAAIQARVARAAARVGTNPQQIKIIAITKTFPAEIVRAAVQCGLTAIGENRVQEALAKMEQLQDLPQIEWHLVGHLQTNKVRKVVGRFALIQAVDSVLLAHKLDAAAAALGTKVDILIEVNTSGETSKFGVAPESLIDLVGEIDSCKNLLIRGLMTVGPLTNDLKLVSRAFAQLRRLFEELQKVEQKNLAPRWLSMGMTDDFEIAIAEGANMLRLGRAIFGERRTADAQAR